MKIENLYAVILAGGRGKRMNSKDKNKVTYEVKGVPMITRTLNTLKTAGIYNIVVVVGFAKESVLALLDTNIKTVEQKKRLGTGHAVTVALHKIPQSAENVLVLYGDDSFWYTKENIQRLFNIHTLDRSDLTLLTTEVDDPTGLGRILRDNTGNITAIVEEKNASEEERKIKEINLACYIFSRSLLEKYLKRVTKNPVTGEYYLTDVVAASMKDGKKINILKLQNFTWRGVNTPKELAEAEKLLTK